LGGYFVISRNKGFLGQERPFRAGRIFLKKVLTVLNIGGIISVVEVNTAPYSMVRDKIKDLGL